MGTWGLRCCQLVVVDTSGEKVVQEYSMGVEALTGE